MISFENDYVAGAHPQVLKRLMETNLESLSGYGSDPYSESAKAKIRKACQCPDAEIEFLAGGTQTNLVVISSVLRDWEGVIAAKTGHINVHEAGAIEYTGHKVLALPHKEGKIEPEALKNYLESFYADETYPHMVFPGMVYISHPTEYGTLYSLKELTQLSEICRSYHIPLYMDGARLGYGLMSNGTDVTLPDVARLCDIFYIGGTKVGALCGEALVFTSGNMPQNFITSIKKRGALLAKGRLCGVQFDALFSDDLYFEIGRHAISTSEELKNIFHRKGIPFYLESPTNQQFVILTGSQMEVLKRQVRFSFWEKLDNEHTVVRFATSWSTTEDDLEYLEKILSFESARS